MSQGISGSSSDCMAGPDASLQVRSQPGGTHFPSTLNSCGMGNGFHPCQKAGRDSAGPRGLGLKEVFAVGEVVVDPAPLQVFVGRHEGWEPEAGGGHPLDKGMGLGRWLAVGLDHRRFDAELFGQPAEPDDGKFRGQDSLEGADAGLEGTHKTITSSTRWSFVT